MITEEEKYRHQTIKYKLNLVGTSLTGVAKKVGVSSNTVNAVSASRSKSMSVAQALADAIGEDVSILFPEYFQDQRKEENMG